MSSASTNVSLGGLVGFNAPGSIIFGSSASGDVIATAGVKEGGEGCSFSNSCQHVSAGGLVGDNLGTIASLSPTAPTFATGNVSVGSNGTAGGLVGFNSGVIANAVAIGSVTGAAGTGGINGEGGSTTLGGTRWGQPGPDFGLIRERKRRKSERREPAGRRLGG